MDLFENRPGRENWQGSQRPELRKIPPFKSPCSLVLPAPWTCLEKKPVCTALSSRSLHPVLQQHHRSERRAFLISRKPYPVIQQGKLSLFDTCEVNDDAQSIGRFEPCFLPVQTEDHPLRSLEKRTFHVTRNQQGLLTGFQ